MNAVIDVNGNLKITALGPTEAFALKVWWAGYKDTSENKFSISVDATTHCGDVAKAIGGVVVPTPYPADFAQANEEHSKRVRGK